MTTSCSGPIVILTAFTNDDSLHMLVWEKDGEELLILTSVQEVIVWVSGRRPQNLTLASVEWPVIVITHVLLPAILY